LDQQFVHPVLFSFRNFIQKPKLDPRIKIFSFDDGTAASLKALDIPLATWGKVIARFYEIKDVKILIDKVFDLPYSDPEIQSFLDQTGLASGRTSIITFTHPGEIPYRKSVPEAVIKESQRVIFDQEEIALKVGQKKRNLYGANSEILRALGRFGHANYEGDNEIDPIFKVGDGLISLHASLTAGIQVSFEGEDLAVNGSRLPLDHNGRLLVDFAPKDFYLKHAYSFLAIIDRTRTGKDFSVIQPGDFVVILPAMYTGNTDFRETPFGPMAGGYHLVAVLQSALSGKWLQKLEDPGFVTFLIGILSFLAAYKLSAIAALILVPFIPMVLFLISAGLFVSFGMVWSFSFPVIAALVLFLLGMSLKSRFVQIEELRIQKELEVAILVQRTFFKTPPGLETNDVKSRIGIVGRYQPATECGGDWWGAFHKNGYTYVFIGDAVGHGVPAALVTAVAFSVTKTVESELAESGGEPLDPVTLMNKINLVLIAMGSNLACMTFFGLRVCEQSGECVFANAGNQQPILIPSNSTDSRLTINKRTKNLAARGDLLGVDENLLLVSRSLVLVSGDKIVLFTDGMIENRSASTQKQIGRNWLTETVVVKAGLDLNLFCEEVWNSYLAAIGSTPADDDATLVAIEFYPASS
jgi:serine phosphatase RsbU (regulator of sigma subunit)